MLNDQPASARMKVTKAPVEVCPNSRRSGVAAMAARGSPNVEIRKRRGRECVVPHLKPRLQDQRRSHTRHHTVVEH